MKIILNGQPFTDRLEVQPDLLRVNGHDLLTTPAIVRIEMRNTEGSAWTPPPPVPAKPDDRDKRIAEAIEQLRKLHGEMDEIQARMRALLPAAREREIAHIRGKMTTGFSLGWTLDHKGRKLPFGFHRVYIVHHEGPGSLGWLMGETRSYRWTGNPDGETLLRETGFYETDMVKQMM